MIRRKPLHTQNLLEWSAAEPRELREREKQLLAIEQQRDAVLGDFVTSASEVALPDATDFISMCLDQDLSVPQLPSR